MYVCVCMYVYMYVVMYVCMYLCVLCDVCVCVFVVCVCTYRRCTCICVCMHVWRLIIICINHGWGSKCVEFYDHTHNVLGNT